MFTREIDGGRLVLGLMLGVGLVISAGSAVAQDEYQGDRFCGLCHKEHPKAWMNKYDEYMQHGHRWIETQTNGQAPGADLFGLASVIDEHGNPIASLSDPTTIKKSSGGFATWEDVRAVLGAYHVGGGSFVMSNGQRVSAGATWNTTATFTNYTKRCFRCHNPTGYSDVATLDDDRIMYGTSASVWRTRVGNGTTIPYEYWFNGAPAKDPFGKRIAGIQCEHCHGPAGQMLNGAALDRRACMDCHSPTSADPAVPSGGDPDQRIRAEVVNGAVTFPNHRPQGPEFRRSAHKAVRAKLKTQGGAGAASAQEVQYVEQGCVLCHDPHKSTWHEKGGVKFVGAREDYPEGAEGDEEFEHALLNMCVECHQKTDHDADFPADQKPKKVRVRGTMGKMGLACGDCHMPDVSASTTSVNGRAVGAERMHIWSMWKGPDKLAAKDHVSPPINDVAYTRTYWLPTEDGGNASMTMDLVCTSCHTNMTLKQMAEVAKGIHRQPGMVDLVVNNEDTLQKVSKNDQVSVAFSIEAGDKKGMKAQWWVICQGPKGWSSWNGKKWVSGLRPWRKGVALADLPEQTVLKAKLPPGYYSYWVVIEPTDGSEYSDGVPVFVSKR